MDGDLDHDGLHLDVGYLANSLSSTTGVLARCPRSSPLQLPCRFFFVLHARMRCSKSLPANPNFWYNSLNFFVTTPPTSSMAPLTARVTTDDCSARKAINQVPRTMRQWYDAGVGFLMASDLSHTQKCWDECAHHKRSYAQLEETLQQTSHTKRPRICDANRGVLTRILNRSEKKLPLTPRRNLLALTSLASSVVSSSCGSPLWM